MPTSQDPNVLAWALGIISTFVVSGMTYFTKDKQARNKQTDDNTKRITKLETTSVTEEHVKQYIKEYVSPVLLGIKSIETMTKELSSQVSDLSMKFEVDKARREERELIMKELEERKHG